MYEVKIEKMDHQGRGIGYIDGKVTFIKNALLEEVVLCEIKKETKNYNEAEVVEYKKKSNKRVDPFCPYFGKCGGCDLQFFSYEENLNYKKDKVINILNKEKIMIPNPVVIKNLSPKNYRNKLSLKVINGRIGFYEESSHSLIEISSCPIAKKSINACLSKLKSLKIENGMVTIRSNYNDEILLVIETKEQVHFEAEYFKEIKLVGVVLNKKTIYGNSFFYERLNGFLFKVSYDAFFQVNLAIAKELFSLVDENLEKTNTVLDLYAGVGTLGLIASKKAKKVYSVEIVKNAVLNLLENKKLNQKENLFPLLGDATKIFSKISEKVDTIIVDPPRKGLDKEGCRLLLNSGATKLIYISCNPLTLARDLKELTTLYSIQNFYILDMFSYTHHVECVCVLKLRKVLYIKGKSTSQWC